MNRYDIKEKINDIDLVFTTTNKCFSPKSIDKGSLAMISAANIRKDEKILDLGCGYGFVGIYAAKVIGAKSIVISDVDSSALQMAKLNILLNKVDFIEIIKSDGLKDIEENDFDVILSNPPYHADFSVPKAFIENGFNHLKLGGRMIMVTKRKAWYKNKFIKIFGGVKIVEINGYYIFTAEKRSYKYNSKRGGAL